MKEHTPITSTVNQKCHFLLSNSHVVQQCSLFSLPHGTVTKHFQYSGMFNRFAWQTIIFPKTETYLILVWQVFCNSKEFSVHVMDTVHQV